jgi:hypothetical protein
MNEISVIFTGVVSIIGAITTLLVRSRLLKKNREDALVLPENKRYDYLLSVGQKMTTTEVSKMSNKDYIALVNKIYDQKEREQKRYFQFAYFFSILVFVLVVMYIKSFKTSANPQQDNNPKNHIEIKGNNNGVINTGDSVVINNNPDSTKK